MFASEDGNLSKKLKQVKVPFVDFNTCEKEYPHKIEEDVMVCAGQKGLDSCQVHAHSNIDCKMYLPMSKMSDKCFFVIFTLSY